MSTLETARPMVTAGNVDLTNCDRELIQFSGAVQPHCGLLVVSEPELRIEQASANTEELFGISADELLGQTVMALLETGEVAELRSKIGSSDLQTPNHVLRVSIHSFNFHVFAHRMDGRLLLEFENSVSEADRPLQDLYAELRNNLAALQTSPTLEDFFQIAVRQIKEFTGFDRVMAYQFLADKSGKVIAEAKEEGLEAYLGLHYPASDIPEPARRLFSQLWLRYLPNVNYEPAPIIPQANVLNHQPIDLSFVAGRSVSAMYSKYLQNMGVQATMVITLQKAGKLWGLISCMHHRAPRHVPYDVRIACEFLGHMVSFTMAAKEEEINKEAVLRLHEKISKLIQQMSNAEPFYRGLFDGEVSALSVLPCSGAAVMVGNHTYTLGDSPSSGELEKIAEWLDEKTIATPFFCTDRLPALMNHAESFKEKASGLLAIRLGRASRKYVLWFRPEMRQSVHWAGDPSKPVGVDDAGGETRLQPRRSFAVWTEEVSGRAEPWTECEVHAMDALQRSITDVVAKKSEQLFWLNHELNISNLELDAFAFAASHDLKEPLRGIHNFSALVVRKNAHLLDEDSQAKMRTIQRLAHRMDELIEALLHYSRVGRAEMAFVETDLNAVLADVSEMLGSRIAERETELRVLARLPKIVCDPIRTREVFANLLSNALKYNDKPKRRIEVGWSEGEERTFWVADNGIGIAPEHHDEVFRIFRRLHGRDEHGGGSGAGLTIARRIVERHGGKIWLESTPHQGTKVLFTLPYETRLGLASMGAAK